MKIWDNCPRTVVEFVSGMSQPHAFTKKICCASISEKADYHRHYIWNNMLWKQKHLQWWKRIAIVFTSRSPLAKHALLWSQTLWNLPDTPFNMCALCKSCASCTTCAHSNETVWSNASHRHKCQGVVPHFFSGYTLHEIWCKTHSTLSPEMKLNPYSWLVLKDHKCIKFLCLMQVNKCKQCSNRCERFNFPAPGDVSITTFQRTGGRFSKTHPPV